MGCVVTNKQRQEIENSMRNGDVAFPKVPNISQEELVERLDISTTARSIETREDKLGNLKESYRVFNEKLRTRVSEKAKRQAGYPEYSVSPDNEIVRQGGTDTHLVLSDLMDHHTKKEDHKSLSQIKAEALKMKTKFQPEHIEQLNKLVRSTMDHIKELQKKIDPNGEVHIRGEQFVFDARAGVGGTIDVIAVFSDGSVGIYDYKTKSGAFGKAVERSGKVHINESLFSGRDVKTYNLSQSEYRRIVLEAYSASKVRENRLIPVLVRYEQLPESKREEGKTLTNKVSHVLATKDASEHLDQLPIGGESTTYMGLNQLLERQTEEKNRLQKKLESRTLTPTERFRIQQRLSSLRNAIITTTKDLDLSDTFKTIYELISETKHIHELETTEDGKDNPLYIGDLELSELKIQLEVYENIMANMYGYLEDLSKTDREKYRKYMNQASGVHTALTHSLLTIGAAITDRLLSKVSEEYKMTDGTREHMIPMKELSFDQRYVQEISESTNPYIATFWEWVRDKQYDYRNDIEQIHREYKPLQQALFEYGRKQGLSKQDTYDLLINRKTGNMYSRLSSEFWEKRSTMMKEVLPDNTAWLKKNYEFKDFQAWKEDYKHNLEIQKKVLKARFNNLEEILDVNGEVIVTAEEQKRKYQHALKHHEASNNLETSDAAWHRGYNYKWLQPKKQVYEQYSTPEYKRIQSAPALKNYYEYWTDSMEKFSAMLGVHDFKIMPENFIPWIRKEMLDWVADKQTSSFGFISEFVDNFLNVREEDVFIGRKDSSSGEFIRNVPKLFLNPFRHKDGKINRDMKAYDLGNSLLLFAGMAHNYKYMSEIEADSIALKNLMAEKNVPTTEGTIETDKRGRAVPGTVQPYKTSKGSLSNSFKLMEDFMDYFLYGIRYKEKSMLKSVDTNKALGILKQYQSRRSLAFGVIPAAGALVAGRVWMFGEGQKGIAFNNKQATQAEKMLSIDLRKDNYKSLGMVEFFQPYAEGITQKLAWDLSYSNIKKGLSDRALFYPLRKIDEKIMDRVLLSMAQNFAVTNEGQLVRLSDPTLDKRFSEQDIAELKKRRIIDLFEYNKDINKWEIPNLPKETFIQFRAAAQKITASIVGNMSFEQISGFQMSTLGSLISQFKTWMPAVVRERTGRLRWDKDLMAFRWGRWRAFFSEFAYTKGEMAERLRITENEIASVDYFTQFITKALVPTLVRLTTDIITFGLVPGLRNRRMNEQRARRRFAQFLAENPQYDGKISFEYFKEVKLGQMRAFMTELRGVLLVLTLVSWLGGKFVGEDQEITDAVGYTNWTSRTLTKILAKGSSELNFLWSPTSFVNLAANPMPILGLATLLEKTLRNTVDETYKLMTGKEDPRDRTPFFYYTAQWAYGGPQFLRLLEAFPQYEQLLYSRRR